MKYRALTLVAALLFCLALANAQTTPAATPQTAPAATPSTTPEDRKSVV